MVNGSRAKSCYVGCATFEIVYRQNISKIQPETLSYRVLDPVNENFDLHGEEWKNVKPIEKDHCHLLYIMAAVIVLNAGTQA